MLPEKTAWIDYILVSNEGLGEAGAYYGVVCTKTQVLGPFSIGSSNDVNGSVAALSAAVTNWLDSANEDRAETSSILAERAAQQHKLLVEPALKLVPEKTESLVLSCDGVIHLVPFAMLPDSGGKFLVERYNVQHADSLRGLANNAAAAKLDPKSQRLFVADPTFAKASDNAQDGADSRRLAVSVQTLKSRAATHAAFPPLPGTAREVEAILHEIAPSAAAPIVRLEKMAATEAAVCRAMLRANLVHFATHGFTLKPGGTAFPAEKDPMNLAGLALAGADSTFNAWQGNGVTKNPNDGILLAGEVAVLDLKRTAQVVLSACDTAGVSIVANNGVIGLRRAFGIAGVPQMVVTLWPVLDDVPESLMKEYYRKVFAGQIGVSSWSACLRSEIGTMRKSQRDVGTMIGSLGTFMLVSNQFPSGPPDPQGVLRLALHGARGIATDYILGDTTITKYFTPAFLARIKATTGNKAGFIERMLPDNLQFVSSKVEGNEAYVEMRGDHTSLTYVLILREGQWLIDDVL
jgi:CHAT domain-containing protein